MSSVEFEAWPKTPRLNRDVVFTEKIDGTNAAVVIIGASEMDHVGPVEDGRFFDQDARNCIGTYDGYAVFAQSRNRFITPDSDNAGFARFVRENLGALVDALGPGRHFGEWWGSGIQRGYGLRGGDKRFSLFNAARWDGVELPERVSVVPMLPFSRIEQAAEAAEFLRATGSLAAPGFDRPEGLIAWHTAARVSFKVLLEGDDIPKGLAA